MNYMPPKKGKKEGPKDDQSESKEETKEEVPTETEPLDKNLLVQEITSAVTKNISALFAPPVKVDSEVDPKDQEIANLSKLLLHEKIPKEKLDSLSNEELKLFAKHPELFNSTVKKEDSKPLEDTYVPLAIDGASNMTDIQGTKYSDAQVALYNFGKWEEIELPFDHTSFDKEMSVNDLSVPPAKTFTHTTNGRPTDKKGEYLGVDGKTFKWKTVTNKRGKEVKILPLFDEKGRAYYPKEVDAA